MLPIELVLIGASAFLLLGIFASKTSEKLGIPVLLLFLLIGMIAGSDGLNLIYFDDAWLAQSVGIIALTFILFDGGISTEWKSVRTVLIESIGLSTIGVFLTALLVGLFASYVLRCPLIEGLLLGSIVSSTDAAAVFAVLRSRKVTLKGILKPLLELESGSNDPMAVFLTIGCIYLITNPGTTLFNIVPIFLSQLIIGTIAGVVMAYTGISALNRLRLEYEGLYPVFTVSLILLTYGITAYLGGSGILAVYLMGLIFGKSNFVHKHSLIYFHNGLAWLMQIVMFLTMGLLVFPSQLIPILPAGLLLALFLMLLARPAAVFITLALTRISLSEKILISWVGLRGSVPIILATFPLLAGLSQSHTIFNLVFFIVVASVLLQGTSTPHLARLLKVDKPMSEGLACAREHMLISGLDSEMTEIVVPEGSRADGKSVLGLALPDGILIVTLRRGPDTIVPGGGTIVKAGDILLVLARLDRIDVLCSIFGVERHMINGGKNRDKNGQ